MQQEAGKVLLLVTALPKISTKPAGARPAPVAAVRRAPAAVARRAPVKKAAQEGIPALLTEVERLLLLKKVLPTKAPSKGNPTSKNSS